VSQADTRQDWEYRREIGLPFTLALETGRELRCVVVLRCLPGRRLVCKAYLDDEPVLMKLFLDAQMEQEAAADAAGVEALMAAHIRTPALLVRDRVAGQAYPLLLFEYLPDTSSFREGWESADAQHQSSLIAGLLQMVASQHLAGLRQRDFHLRNFLLDREGDLYAIDGGDYLTSAAPVNRAAALENLGVLFGHLPRRVLVHEPKLLEHYLQSRQWLFEPELMDKVFTGANNFRRRRARIISRKAFRDCSEFKVWRKGALHINQRRDLDSQLLIDWIETSRLDLVPETDVMLKPGNSQTVWQTRLGGTDVVVKRYNIKNWRHALRRAFSRSRASRSWENAHALRAYHIRTPEPLVMIEQRTGPIRRRAWFITRVAEGTGANEFFNGREMPEIKSDMRRLADLVSAFGENDLVHGDMKATNFLLSAQAVQVIDLDSMRQDAGPVEIAEDRRRFLANWQEDAGLRRLFAGLLHRPDQR
jgi:tRNA A-37 threonylcarbamoyl transferase component Bud32